MVTGRLNQQKVNGYWIESGISNSNPILDMRVSQVYFPGVN